MLGSVRSTIEMNNLNSNSNDNVKQSMKQLYLAQMVNSNESRPYQRLLTLHHFLSWP